MTFEGQRIVLLVNFWRSVRYMRGRREGEGCCGLLPLVEEAGVQVGIYILYCPHFLLTFHIIAPWGKKKKKKDLRINLTLLDHSGISFSN